MKLTFGWWKLRQWTGGIRAHFFAVMRRILVDAARPRIAMARAPASHHIPGSGETTILPSLHQ
jgi:hypothetical protein